MRRFVVVAALLIGVLLTAGTVTFAKDPFVFAGPEVDAWFEPAEPIRIVGPIHFVGTRGLGVYLIEAQAGHMDEGHILLFGAMPKSADLIVASVRKAGFKVEDIGLLLTCHAHIDHVGTHARLQELSGAKVAMMEQEVELLQSGGATDFHYGNWDAFRFPKVQVDQVLHDGTPVKWGGVELTPQRTPGHTKGGTTWSMTVHENGTPYKVVFPDGTSVNPGYRLVRHPSYAGIADDYKRTLSVLEGLNPDIWLHSHLVFFDFDRKRELARTKGVAAWVDRDGYRKFVQSRRETIEKKLADEASGPDIVGTLWRLAGFGAEDGTKLDADPETQTSLEFRDDGRVAVRIQVNRGSGTWQLGGWKEIALGPLALTRAAGPPNALADRFARDWSSIRRYELVDGRLYLSLADDAGRYELERAPAAPSGK